VLVLGSYFLAEHLRARRRRAILAAPLMAAPPAQPVDTPERVSV
jgi:hypothetical protein